MAFGISASALIKHRQPLLCVLPRTGRAAEELEITHQQILEPEARRHFPHAAFPQPAAGIRCVFSWSWGHMGAAPSPGLAVL